MMFFRLLILVAIIAVALSVGLYFGLQDNSSGKNSTETGTTKLPLPDDTENDTITDDKENDANESADDDKEKKPDADNAEAQVDPVVESTEKTTTTTTAKATTTTTTTPSVVVENVGSVIAPRKYGCFSGSEFISLLNHSLKIKVAWWILIKVPTCFAMII